MCGYMPFHKISTYVYTLYKKRKKKGYTAKKGAFTMGIEAHVRIICDVCSRALFKIR